MAIRCSASACRTIQIFSRTRMTMRCGDASYKLYANNASEFRALNERI